jgi:hypothetical protein
MLYLIVGLLALAMIGTGGGYYKGRTDGVDIYKAKVEAQQREIEAAAAELKQKEANNLIDMEAAFDQGKQEGQQQAKVVYVKGAQYAASDKGISNPVCAMSDDSLHFLNLARSDVRAAAAASGPGSGLSQPAANNGQDLRGAVQPSGAGREPVSGVPGEPAPLRGAGQVPGLGVPAHPKPTPITK